MPSRVRAMLTTSLEDCATGALRVVVRLAVGVLEVEVRSRTASSAGAGAGFGFGFATALRPATPMASLATGEAGSGATIAGARLRATGSAGAALAALLTVAPVAVATSEGLACAGREKVATRPPDAASRADALTLVSPALRRMVESSVTGL